MKNNVMKKNGTKNSGKDICRQEKTEGKREVCRRPNKSFNPQSSDCKRCSFLAKCPKNAVVSLNEEQFNNMFSG